MSNSLHEHSEQHFSDRFGCDAPSGSEQLEHYYGHRSCRKFSTEPIDEDTIRALLGAGFSAASSSHLQCCSVVSVQSPEKRAILSELCSNQQHIIDASWFFAFVMDFNRLRRIASENGTSAPATDSLEFLLVGTIDVALVAERLVCAAESIGIGTCYIGALRNHVKKVQELLELPDDVFPMFGLCMGYPSSVPDVKPRLPLDAVWHKETYKQADSWHDLDERMRAVYESLGQDGAVTWSARMARRCDDKYLGSRIELRNHADRGRIDQR